MSATNAKPRVALIGTGGTISSIATDSLDVLDYPDASRKAQPAEIIGRTPELARFADVVPINFREVGSTAIGPADWLELVQLIHQTEAQNGGFDGYVILHGTATLDKVDGGPRRCAASSKCCQYRWPHEFNRSRANSHRPADAWFGCAGGVK